jgi:hypothetical protein
MGIKKIGTLSQDCFEGAIGFFGNPGRYLKNQKSSKILSQASKLSLSVPLIFGWFSKVCWFTKGIPDLKTA